MFSDQMIEDLSADGSYIGYAIEIDFGVDGVTRAHSGVGNIVLNGELFYGVGELGSVGQIESVGDAKPSQLTVELSGVPGEVLSDALKAKARGNSATLYTLVFDDTMKLKRAEVALPGFVVDYNVVSGSDNKVSVVIADEFELFEMPWYKFWTDESHQLDYDGDRICRYASQMEDREIQWGSKNDAPPFRRQ